MLYFKVEIAPQEARRTHMLDLVISGLIGLAIVGAALVFRRIVFSTRPFRFLTDEELKNVK